MTPAPKIAVIIPARDAGVTIERCVSSLAAQELGEPWQAILVDDGSSDDTAALAARAANGCALNLRVLAATGVGPAAARNQGASESAADVLAFLDADCFPAPGWLAAGLRALENADLVQGRVVPDPEIVRGPFDRTLHVNGPSPLFESANLFVRRELFEGLGGFEAWLAPEVGKAVAEDVWFGWRARRAGAGIAYSSEVLAHHAVFREGALAHVLDRRRLAHFPAIAAKVPEIRDELFFARWFLSRRTALVDAAVVGAAVAILLRRPGPLALTLPYGAAVAADAIGWRRLAGGAAIGRVAADVVGFWALARGSARHRSLVL